MGELKPCPLCGLPASNLDGATGERRIGCFREECHMGFVWYREGDENDRLRAEKEWNAIPRKLQWTDKKPDESNHWQWFWYRDSFGRDPYPVYIQVAWHGKEKKVYTSVRPDSDRLLPIDKMGGVWAGPILEPQE
ncbi:MAG: hypothetical protein IJA79_00615 [Desulfovibrio sp.]|nr:hypothetical protein [Desulfovibrio sp.]